MGFADIQIPELMLQDNGHFLGVCGLQGLGHLHAICCSLEGDIEVAIAGQTFMFYQRKRASHNGTKGVLDQ